MRFTREQYEKAIEHLQCGMTQLAPDGDGCHVCGDSGHQAFECRFNPLVAMAICEGIAKTSEDLHEKLHFLAGHESYMGVQIGPAAVVVPPVTAQQGDRELVCKLEMGTIVRVGPKRSQYEIRSITGSAALGILGVSLFKRYGGSETLLYLEPSKCVEWDDGAWVLDEARP